MIYGDLAGLWVSRVDGISASCNTVCPRTGTPDPRPVEKTTVVCSKKKFGHNKSY